MSKGEQHTNSDFDWHPNPDFMEQKLAKKSKFGVMGRSGY